LLQYIVPLSVIVTNFTGTGSRINQGMSELPGGGNAFKKTAIDK